MRPSVVISIGFIGLLVCFLSASAMAEDSRAGSEADERGGLTSAISDDPEDPDTTLRIIRERNAQRESLFPVSPLKGLHDITTRWKSALYEKIGLELGLTINHLFQGVSDAIPDKDKWGTTTDADIIAV